MIAKSEREIRLDKLKELVRMGVDPYPGQTPEHQPLAEVKKLAVGEIAATVGRLNGLRTHGQASFLDLVAPDSLGGEEKLQLYGQVDLLEEKYDLVKYLDLGDYLWVRGEFFLTKTGEPTLKLQDLVLLAKSLLPIPDSWQGLKDTETRYRHRTLDFKINSRARQTIATRSKIIQATRQYFDQLGFLEIETPILQPIPGGATAKPFVTRYNTLDANFYLRISSELYLKRLVAGGFEKVYEIGPVFRNEGLSHMHSPEFTMCEFYWAYKNYRDLIILTEVFIRRLVKQITGQTTITYQQHGLDFAKPFQVVRFMELFTTETGINLEKATNQVKLLAEIKKVGLELDSQPSTWAETVDELFKKAVRPKIIQPTFVIDYPIELSPLAKTKPGSPKIAERFQLLLAGGFELVNAYTEQNDPLLQQERFRDQAKLRQAGWDEAQMFDANYIESLKFGLPPTAGWGMGIDRLAMLLTDNYSIKEVIAFPTLRPEG
ncbi:MAG: lysine--tRNA ligase [Patescibacteria group bacterium]